MIALGVAVNPTISWRTKSTNIDQLLSFEVFDGCEQTKQDLGERGLSLK